MLQIERWMRLARGPIVVALLALTLVGMPARAAQGQSGCAVARGAVGGPAHWLAGCGRVARRGSPEAIARAALAAHAGALGLRADGADLQLLAVAPTSAATHVRFQQVYAGVPVVAGQVLVQYDASGEIQLINNHTLPDLQLDVAPSVDFASAAATAIARVAPSGGEVRRGELAIDGHSGTPELAWQIVIFAQAPPAEWHVLVSARGGQVLRFWNALTYDSGSGLRYGPNPVQQTGNTGLRDNGDAASAALNNARVAVTLKHLNANTTRLIGSYVDLTGTGIDQSNICPLAYLPGQANEPSRTYNYTRDDDRFEEVNAYAAIDGVQTWFQSLGFTNILNQPIAVDVHCDNNENSFFSTEDDGLHFGDGGVDAAEDADIVIHEYGHAVQQALVPGWGTGSNTEQRALGEGFGDFLAGMYNIDQGNPSYLSSRKYCIGEWDATAYNPLTQNNAGSGCLRWINGRDEQTGGDIGRYSGSPSEEHNDGRFWSAALTCMYEGMGANAAARDKIMRLVLQHQFSLTPDESNNAFEDAVDALVLADQNLFGGADRALIKNCAYARGVIPMPTPIIATPVSGGIVPRNSAINITWTIGDPLPGMSYRLEYSDECVTSFSDTVEAGANGWAAGHAGGGLDWQIATSDTHSPTHSWFAGDEGAKNDQYLVSAPIAICGSPTLSFWQRYNLESTFDGGVVEISTNNGASWADLGGQFIQNGYNDAISSSSTTDSPIKGRAAFTGIRDWAETKAALSSFNGKSIRLRFREADDASVAAAGQSGWWVDDIALTPSPNWKFLATTAVGATSYRWSTPDASGVFSLRVRGEASGYPNTDYSPIRIVTLGSNTTPTIANISDRSMNTGSVLAPISFTIGDAETAPANLVVIGSSSNPALVPNANIVFSGSGANRVVTIAPAPGQTGATTITITVSDGVLSASDSLALTVKGSRRAFLPLLRR
jgi:hypothetical protein